MKVCTGEHQHHREIVYDELETDSKGRLLRCPLCIAIERVFDVETDKWRDYGHPDSLGHPDRIINSGS